MVGGEWTRASPPGVSAGGDLAVANSLHRPVPDELHDLIAGAVLPLLPSLRSAFTMQVLAQLRACPAETLGVGLAHRICAEEQRHFLKAGSVAVGGKYGG